METTPTAPNRTAWIAEQNRRHRARTISLIAEWHDGGLSGHKYHLMVKGCRRFNIDPTTRPAN